MTTHYKNTHLAFSSYKQNSTLLGLATRSMQNINCTKTFKTHIVLRCSIFLPLWYAELYNFQATTTSCPMYCCATSLYIQCICGECAKKHMCVFKVVYKSINIHILLCDIYLQIRKYNFNANELCWRLFLLCASKHKNISTKFIIKAKIPNIYSFLKHHHLETFLILLIYLLTKWRSPSWKFCK